jgi:hypothetical protein
MTSTAATKIIKEGHSIRKTAKSIASLLYVSNPCLECHRTPTSDGRTRGSCLLLDNALLRVFLSSKAEGKQNNCTLKTLPLLDKARPFHTA